MSEQQTIFDGMLKLHVSEGAQALFDAAVKVLPEEAKPIRREVRHVSLIHQKHLKPWRKELKAAFKAGSLKEFPAPLFMDDPIKVVRDERTSWILVASNQVELRKHCKEFLAVLGEEPKDTRRVYHVTIANLTGSRKDSVGDVDWMEVGRCGWCGSDAGDDPVVYDWPRCLDCGGS